MLLYIHRSYLKRGNGTSVTIESSNVALELVTNANIKIPGYYALHEANAKGCLQCFCYGITSECRAAELGVEVIPICFRFLLSIYKLTHQTTK